jgi:hypothetical protein
VNVKTAWKKEEVNKRKKAVTSSDTQNLLKVASAGLATSEVATCPGLILKQ